MAGAIFGVYDGYTAHVALVFHCDSLVSEIGSRYEVREGDDDEERQIAPCVCQDVRW